MLLLLPLLWPFLIAPAQEPTPMGTLSPGAIEAHTIEAGGMHVWELEAESDCRVEGRLLQLEGDALLVVTNPKGQVAAFDFSDEGREPFRFHRTQAGTYLLSIQASGNSPHQLRYELYLGICEPVATGFEARVAQWVRTASPREPAVAVWVVQPGSAVQLFFTGISLADSARSLRDDEALPTGEIELDLARLAVLSLIQNGKLDRNASLAEAANLLLFDPRATVSHLLHGTAGIRDLELVERLRLAATTTRRIDSDRFAALAERQREAAVEPGTEGGRPTDRMTGAFLRRVCSTITGEEYSAWVTREILRPMRMHDSRILTGAGAEGPFWTDMDWSDRRWVGTNPILDQEWAVPMVSLRDMSRWIEFLHSDDALAVQWREEFGYPVFESRGPSSVAMLSGYEDGSPERCYVYFDLGKEEGGPDTRGLWDALVDKPWGLASPGQEMGVGRRGGRRIPPLPTTPVQHEVAGVYFAPEVDLSIQLVRRVDGHLEFVHPLREKPIQFFQHEDPHRAVSRWILMRSIRFILDEDNRVIGFRATGNGLSDILFDRKESDN